MLGMCIEALEFRPHPETGWECQKTFVAILAEYCSTQIVNFLNTVILATLVISGR
jgi:hypothetical protein